MNNAAPSSRKSDHSYAHDDWLYRTWRNPTNGRFYHAELKQDLFRNWVVTRRWGRSRSRRSQSMEVQCDNYEAALLELATIDRRRAQRGYVSIN